MTRRSGLGPALWPRLVIACGGLAPSARWTPATRRRPTPAGGRRLLTVCAVPAVDAADREGAGRDAAGASTSPWPSAWAASLGRPVEFHWCASAECAWNCLPEGRCDVVVGQPLDSGPPRDVAWSVPYAGARFGLVVPRDAPGVRSLADLRGKRVGIVAGTVALAEKDHAVVRFKTREALLDGFAAAALDAAFLDADFAAWYLHEHPQLGLRLVDELRAPRALEHGPGRPRRGCATLLVAINRALAQLAESGELRKVYAEHGVPFRPPFTGDRPAGRRPPTPGGGSATAASWSSAWTPPTCPIPAPGTTARASTSSWPGPWPSGSASSSGSNGSTSSARPRSASCSSAGATSSSARPSTPTPSPTTSRWRARSSTRGPTTGRATCSSAARTGPRVRSLAELKGERRDASGTEAGSIADYRLRQRGYLRRLYRNQLATLKALDDGDIDFAYLWANVGWTLHASPDFASSSSSRATCPRTTGTSRSPCARATTS